MELKGKAHPIALSLLVNTSSETPSAARASGTEKGLCHGKGSPPFQEMCVQILGYLAAGMEGAVQLELGWVGEPVGLWHSRVRGGTAGLGAAGGAWVVFTLSWLHISPWDLSSTICFSPPNPSAKAKISTEQAKQILFCPKNPRSHAGTHQMKFPQCLQMGMQPFISKSGLHKMCGVLKAQNQKQLYFFPTAYGDDGAPWAENFQQRANLQPGICAWHGQVSPECGGGPWP